MSVVIETLFALFNVLLWCWILVARPTHFICPLGWHDDGASRDGQFTCTRRPVGPLDWDGTYLRPERSTVPPGQIRGQIYCTGGSMPVVISDRAVGCQRGARWQSD